MFSKRANRFSQVLRTTAAMMGLALVLAACSEEKAEVEEVIRPVKVVEISGTDEDRGIIYSGSVKARTEANLGFRVSGKIIERTVDIGERVKPGDIIARIDPTDLHLAVKSAEAAVISAKAQLDTTALNEKRAQQLVDKGVASTSALDQRKLEHDQAVSAYEAALSARDQAANQAAYAELKSDVGGIVTAVPGVAGQVVSAGTPVVTVARDGEKEIAIAVPEQEIRHFTAGKTVDARFWADTALSLQATVREVAGSADPASRTYAVRLSIPDDPAVLLGMTASVEMHVGSAGASVTVPVASLAEKDGKPVVWLVDRASGVVSSKPVTVSGFAEEGARISAGLAKGDVVVSAGTQFMSDGLKVKLPDDTSTQISKL